MAIFQDSVKQPLSLAWWIKFSIVLCTLIFTLFFSLPTFFGDMEVNPETQGYKRVINKIITSVLPDVKVSLGLDLKGGLHLVLEVDDHKSVVQNITRAYSRSRDSLKSQSINIPEVITLSETFAYELPIESEEISKKVSAAIEEQTAFIRSESYKDGILKFEGVQKNIEVYRENILKQAITTIRNRIDEFGVAEPSIFQQGQKHIVIQMPGVKDPKRAKELIGNTAQLDFRMVFKDISHEQLKEYVGEAQKNLGIDPTDVSIESIEKCSEWLTVNKKLPEGTTLILQRIYEVEKGIKVLTNWLPYLVEANPKVTGEMIENAQVFTTYESVVPEERVFITFTPQGAKFFGDLTQKAIDNSRSTHQIAIILDSNINSAPTVSEPILNGTASITTRSATDSQTRLKEAQDLALVLRAGSLPASVKVVEEREIGPSEGEENIQAGIYSTLGAAAVVMLLMLIVYGGSGIIAITAMIFNVFLILALLACFGATLTLPGIAGIVLTMAIAVDGNVIINERIREEIRHGLSPRDAFYKGYQSSFFTLVDAHITSAVAGLVLLFYGNPSVKGFAVSLLVGIISTLFTSYTVTEVIGQWLLEKTGSKKFI